MQPYYNTPAMPGGMQNMAGNGMMGMNPMQQQQMHQMQQMQQMQGMQSMGMNSGQALRNLVSQRRLGREAVADGRDTTTNRRHLDTPRTRLGARGTW